MIKIWLLSLSPLLYLGSFYLFILIVRLQIGHFPVYGFDNDYNASEQTLAFILATFFISLLLSFWFVMIVWKEYVNERRFHRLPILVFAILFLGLIIHVRFDPLLTWLVD